MTNDAIINGKVIELDQEEVKRASEFHKKRIPFIIKNDTIIVNNNKEDDRDHQHWVLEDFNIGVEEFEKIPRGYMLPDRVQLFIGSGFEAIDDIILTNKLIDELIDIHFKIFGKSNFNIYNGVKIGKIGDIWKPLNTITKIEY